MTVRYSARARSQIDYIFDWLSERNVGAAHDVVTAIQRVLKAVSKWPKMGKATDEGDVRVAIVPRYSFRIFYRIEGDVCIPLSPATEFGQFGLRDVFAINRTRLLRNSWISSTTMSGRRFECNG